MFVKESVKRVKTVKYRVEKALITGRKGDGLGAARAWTFEPDDEHPHAETFPVRMVTFSFSAVDGRWELRDYAVECDTGRGPGTMAVAVPGLAAPMPGWLAELAVSAAQER